MGVLEVKLPGRVLWLNPRRRIATVGVASVGRGRSFRAAYAAPGAALARAVEYIHGYGAAGRTVGVVVAVRPAGSGAEVDVHVTGDMAWLRLADRGASVDISCAFTHAVGPDPFGGRVERIDIS